MRTPFPVADVFGAGPRLDECEASAGLCTTNSRGRIEGRGCARPLSGFTVGVTAARRAGELGALLRRRGAAVVHGPALRIVPLGDDGELRSVTRELVERGPDLVVASTAVGFRGGSRRPMGGVSARSCSRGWGRPNCWPGGPR